MSGLASPSAVGPLLENDAIASSLIDGVVRS
jgi:hypothetical protein